VVTANGLAVILFMISYLLFGVVMIRTATVPRWAGVLVAVGAPAHFAGFRDSSAGVDRRVADRDPGQCESWRRPRLARLSALARTNRFRCRCVRYVDTSMSTDPSDNAVVNPPSAAHRVRVIIFRVVATLAGLFFVVAVVLMASAPWVLLQPDQDVRTELNRWFLTVAGSVDAITVGVLLALALQPRRTLLVVELAGAVIVAGAIILPFQPSFAAIPAIGVVPLLAYPYWREVRFFSSWWAGVSRPCSSSPRWRVPGFS
jgi:hypothetical protein